MRNLSQSIVLAMRMRLPRLAEQHRTIANVDKLMPPDDRLDAGLAATNGTRNRLLESRPQDTLAPSVYQEAAAGMARP